MEAHAGASSTPVSATRRIARAAAAWVLAVSVSLVPSTGQDPGPISAPFETRLTEETGISLVFVDVEVRDETGRPLAGLTAADFEVFLDYREYPIYSVDDLCTCAGAPGEDPVTGGAPADVETPRFVLYFDSSQLLESGRASAREQAERWVQKVMQPGDEVSVVTFASRAGLRELVPFTTDRKRVLEAIETTFADPVLADPLPRELVGRRESCDADPIRRPTADRFECRQYAMEEYFHTRRSLRALLVFLTRLQAVEGRKELLLFYQTTVMDPKQAYGTNRNVRGRENPVDFVDDHLLLVDEVAGTAMAARTRVHPVFTGPFYPVDTTPADTGRAAVNFGANLAEYTGGDYNRGPQDLQAVLDGAGRGCACRYRIGLEPRADQPTRVYRMRVDLAGRPLPRRYRVQFLSPDDRWLREAEALLLDPGAARGLPVRAAVIPERCRNGRWDVSVQVAFDPAALLMLREGPRLKGTWEVAAVLASSEGGKGWDLLGVSQATKDPERAADDESDEGDEPDRGVIVHERRIEGLRPQAYELRAFVRDRATDVAGGAMVTVTLPRPGRAGLAGPIAIEAEAEHLVSGLPRRGTQGTIRGEVRDGRVALGDRRVEPGESIEFHSWLCSEAGPPSRESMRRYVTRAGVEVLEPSPPAIDRAGECFRVGDTIETSDLSAGDYEYHVEWIPDAGSERLRGRAAFAIAGSSTASLLPN